MNKAASRNRICAVDVETTGRIPKVHEIVEIAIVPLTDDFRVDEDVPVFHERARAEYPGTADPEAMAKHGLDVTEGRRRREIVADLLAWMREWRIRLIEPLGHNLDFDMKFTDELLGDYRGEVFSHVKRDSMRTAQTLKDASGGKLFPSRVDVGWRWRSGTSLEDVRRELGLETNRSQRHRALHDALGAAKCYRRMIEMILTGLPPY